MKFQKSILILLLMPHINSYGMYADELIELNLDNKLSSLVGALDQNGQYHDIFPCNYRESRKTFKLEPNRASSFKIFHPGTASVVGTIYTILYNKNRHQECISFCIREARDRGQIENVEIGKVTTHQKKSVNVTFDSDGTVSWK